MPFIPHTPEDISAMLNAIGVDDIAQLFDEIPEKLRYQQALTIPDAAGFNELEATRFFRAAAQHNTQALNFIGAGAYEHHIPAAVWELASRGEFMTAYTPYQAEASQGSLQLIYEYQTMIASLTDMPVANASLYDGATALAEAVLMAVRIQAQKKNKTKRILVAESLHPSYLATVKTIVERQNIKLVTIPINTETGLIDIPHSVEAFSALVIPFPNFFGGLEAVDQLTDWAHERQALVIAMVNPMALGLLKPPGQWGVRASHGADIVCGELQPFGMPLAFGGPYAGFMCCQQQYIRQLPGRIVGQTEDSDGKVGYVLTLQAREQHIRRSKATSNICTNQGLLVTAATIYMSLLGPQGIYKTALKSHQNIHALLRLLAPYAEQYGVKPYFAEQAIFHECVLALPCPARAVIDQLAEQGIFAGVAMNDFYPDKPWDNLLLVCTTETKTPEDLTSFSQALGRVLARETNSEQKT